MTKRIFSLAIFVSFFYSTMRAQCIKPDPQVEAQVETILSRLSLKEKVGQMCQLTIDCVSPNRQASEADKTAGGLLSSPAMQRVFGEYKVGSILNVPGGTAVSPAQWSEMIRTLNQSSLEQCHGVPQLYGVDQIHGASYTRGATLFPQEIGQGASFNKDIPLRIGQITAYESRACLIPWTFSPVMDLARTPLWSRMWESFGEDVLVNGTMASQLVRGLQGGDPNHVDGQHMAACLKHYLAYGAPVSGKDRTPSSVTDREMFEKFFIPYRMCVEAGALSLMVNSANNNGIPFHCNKMVLTDWLKEGLQWDGMIVTDWADIDNIWQRDHVAANKKDAICLAINAGIDMSMDPYNTNFCTLLEELVNEGRVPMERINDAVRRILRLKIRLGLFDKKTWDKSPKQLAKAYPDFASQKFADEAVAITEECMVLLKNEATSNEVGPILPLTAEKLARLAGKASVAKRNTSDKNPAQARILVCGPNSNNFRPMNGGWSYSWQGDKADAVCRELGSYKTFYDALADKFGRENVELCEMVRYEGSNWQHDKSTMDASKMTAKAAEADVIIACIGENSYCETPGNIDDLTLSSNQLNMVKALKQSGKPIILILNEGRPRLITDIEPMATAIVHTFLPSNYGGVALANLLCGDANFSGRLPYTYPRKHGSFATYDYKPAENVATMNGAYNYDAKMDVLYPFGSGLSYTQVKYSDLTAQVSADEREVTFLVNVSNTGQVATKEPVLLFVSDMVASLTPDVKRLRAFTKIDLAPGETKQVQLRVNTADLAFVGLDMKWVLEAGQFRAAVGGLSTLFTLKQSRVGEPYIR